jgi:hypothetical protein
MFSKNLLITLFLILFSKFTASLRSSTTVDQTKSQGTPRFVKVPSPLLCSFIRLSRS